MEDFYPFTSEDIPELFPVGQRHVITVKSWVWEWADKTAVSLLLTLLIDLLDYVERIRAMKNYFQVEYGVNSDAKISEGFLKIVKAYLEENNGTRDLSPITELLKSDGHPVCANDLEMFFLQYSLPASEVRETPSINLKSDSLPEKKSIAVSSGYFWNNNCVEQSLENSGILEEIFKKLRAELISRQTEQAFKTNDWMQQYRREKGISLLIPLAIDLLDNVEGIRALKNSFQEEFNENRYAEVGDGFLKILKAYLEENGGTGNLLKITEVLSSNGHFRIAEYLETFFLQYSLRACSEGSENANTSGDVLQAQADKKSTAGNSIEEALQNSVIVEEIFTKLQIEDQKLVRLVSPTLLKETMPFWRRNARVSIWVSKLGLALTRFMDLWEMKKERKEISRAKAMQRLNDVPFRSFKVSYHSSMTLYSSESEKKFWRLCCWQIENLKIQTTQLNIAKLCKFVLKNFCRNLKQLEINCHNWERIPNPDISSSEEEEERKEDNQAQLVPVKKVKIAKNLQTLIFNKIDPEALRSILFVCPNLEELRLWKDGEGAIGALLSPTSKGEFIKLKKLVIFRISYTIDDFVLLRQYIEMLAENRFDSLEHLQLQTRLSSARSAPFNLYAALTLASKNLKTLHLELIPSEDNSNENSGWFMDLSPFAFTNLSKLNLILDFSDKNVPFGLDFDFGTLKGMPMLEKLKINTKNVHREVVRKDGTQDWVFEGNRKRYLPSGVKVNYRYSYEDPILCSNLKEFTFHHDWSLNEEDVRLLSSWFPNLTLLEAGVKSEALPLIVENWQRLEKLVIHTEKLIPLRKFRTLKEAKKTIKIFQKFFIDGKVTDEDGPGVELKEKNGWLFFSV